MSIKKNTVANFAGQFYKAAIGLAMLPVYLTFLGEEAFGMVAFFTLLNAWLVLLSASLAPTLARQVAFARGRGNLGEAPFREMLRSLELIVLAIALAIMLLGLIGSEWLATHWLTVKTISLADVTYCIALMGVMIGLALGTALYSSGISGLEQQIWLNGFGIGFATLRFGAAYVLLRWVSSDVVHFFEYQLALSLLELAIVARKFYICQPAGARRHDPGLAFSWPAIRSVLPFTMGVAYTSMLWVFMTQSDKLVLSHVLSLSDFGFFSIVVHLANGVLLIAGPFTRAIIPRMTMLHSQGNHAAMLALYRTTTQFLAVIVFSVGGMLACFSQPIIFALTGNQAAAEWGSPVLTWFAMGNAILVIVGMQYSLQFAHGQVRMHVINTTINAVVQVPILVYFAFNYGAEAVAKAWFAIRLITFFVWPAIVHRKFAPGMHWKWIYADVMLPLLGAVLGLGLIEFWMISSPTLFNFDSRLEIVAVLSVLGVGVLITCSILAYEVRSKGVQLLANVYHRLV
jgi:O-antigen/teichoic acid export membrane protein